MKRAVTTGRGRRLRITVILRVGGVFIAVGAGLAALGIASLANVIRGGWELAVFTLILSAVTSGLVAEDTFLGPSKRNGPP
jgi:hypothetical protein